MLNEYTTILNYWVKNYNKKFNTIKRQQKNLNFEILGVNFFN